jgi:hypothetical protein
LWAGILFLASPRKSSQKEGDPRVGTGFAGPLRYSVLAGAAELGLRPQTVLALFPPAPALLSASHGDPKSVSQPSDSLKNKHYGQFEKAESQKISTPVAQGWFTGVPMRGAEQRRNVGGLRRGLSEGRSPEFRSRALNDAKHREEVLLGCPTFRVAQGTGQRPAPTLGSPFLWLLSFGDAKESTPAHKAESQAYYEEQNNKSRTSVQLTNEAHSRIPAGLFPSKTHLRLPKTAHFPDNLAFSAGWISGS